MKEPLADRADSNSIKFPFICPGGQSNRLGKKKKKKAKRFAQQLRGPTFAQSRMDPPSVSLPGPLLPFLPRSSHMFLPPTNVWK